MLEFIVILIQHIDVCKLDLGKASQLSFTIEESRLQKVVENAIERIENIDLNERDTWSTFFSYFQLVKSVIDPVSEVCAAMIVTIV